MVSIKDVILITDNDERLREKYVHQETLEISTDHFSRLFDTAIYIQQGYCQNYDT